MSALNNNPPTTSLRKSLDSFAFLPAVIPNRSPVRNPSSLSGPACSSLEVGQAGRRNPQPAVGEPRVCAHDWRKGYGVRELRGRQTFEEFVRLEAAHDLNHLRQIDRILGRRM